MQNAISLANLSRLFWAILFFASASASAPAAAQRFEERPTEESSRHYLEGQIARHYGAQNLEAARTAPSSIIALGAYGEFATHVPRGLLIRERGGWSAHQSGGMHPLTQDVSREIDRILASPAFWRERAFNPEQLCTGGARLMTVRHARRVRTSRQSCAPVGLVGRLAEIAVTGRTPPLPPVPPVEPRTGMVPTPEDSGQGSVSQAIWERSQAAAIAWNRGDMEAFLALYAEDVAIVWPTGIEYNKQALRARTRAAQAWNGPPARRMQVHSSMDRQLGSQVVLQSYQLRFSGGGRPDTQMWVTAIWQNRRGTWEVTHEQTGAETVGYTR